MKYIIRRFLCLGIHKLGNTMAVINSLVALSAILLTVNSMSVVVSDKKCVPMQWESVLLGLVAQSDNGKSAIYEVVGSIHYDYNKAMEAALENVYVDDKLIASYKIIVSQVSDQCYRSLVQHLGAVIKSELACDFMVSFFGV